MIAGMSQAADPSETAMAGAPPEARQSDRAFDVLKAEIVSCRLRPGSSVSEAVLAERFGFGRAATRSALTRLSALRLVLPVPRAGHTIAPITVQSIQELFELRLMLEPHAARLAAGRVDVDALRRTNRSPQSSRSDREKLSFVAANRAFHLLIAESTRNERLVAVLEALGDEAERLVHVGLFGHGSCEQDRSDADDDHQAIISAFERNDADAAADAMAVHIERSRDAVLARVNSGPSRWAVF